MQHCNQYERLLINQDTLLVSNSLGLAYEKIQLRYVMCITYMGSQQSKAKITVIAVEKVITFWGSIDMCKPPFSSRDPSVTIKFFSYNSSNSDRSH